MGVGLLGAPTFIKASSPFLKKRTKKLLIFSSASAANSNSRNNVLVAVSQSGTGLISKQSDYEVESPAEVICDLELKLDPGP